jgi:AcrR family transcriptional regulator
MIVRIAQRQERRVAEIVAAAWGLARVHGVGGFSLHALAREVGIRQPSLYAHFDSKHALFDAMFTDGNRQLIAHLDGLELPNDPRAALKVFAHAWVDFGLEDPARYALLFQRPIPGYQPSPDAYGYAQAAFGRVVALLRAAGVVDPGDVDCCVAMVGGLMDSQFANDPGGDRLIRHLDRLIDMYLNEIHQRRVQL